MSKQSAGILVFHQPPTGAEVLLVHPAGPIWSKRDVWSIPKGEVDENEDHLTAAYREFEEEVGIKLPKDTLIALGAIKQSSGKTNFIWAMEGDIDVTLFKCNLFTMEWPPKSGTMQEFPENDHAAWFNLGTAKQKLFGAQRLFIDRLAEHLQIDLPTSPSQESLF